MTKYDAVALATDRLPRVRTLVPRRKGLPLRIGILACICLVPVVAYRLDTKDSVCYRLPHVVDYPVLSLPLTDNHCITSPRIAITRTPGRRCTGCYLSCDRTLRT